MVVSTLGYLSAIGGKFRTGLVKAVAASPTKFERGQVAPHCLPCEMFPSGAEEPASGSDGVSMSALFTSPNLEINIV